MPLGLYIIFVGAVPENISRFGQMVRSRSSDDANKPDQYRAPERVPVQTGDGIEIIEVCPAVDCEEECPCGDAQWNCPVQLPCPVCSTKTAPIVVGMPDGGPAGRDP